MPQPVYLNLQGTITQELAMKVINAVQSNLQQGMTELHLLMATGGGFVDPGMSIYNFLRAIPVPVTTYNYGNVDSISGVIYCAGVHRVATPHCKFLIHGITWTINQATALTEHQIREYLGQIEAMKRNIASVIAEA